MRQLDTPMDENRRIQQFMQREQNVPRGAQGPDVHTAIATDGFQHGVGAAFSLREYFPTWVVEVNVDSRQGGDELGDFVRRGDGGGRRSGGGRVGVALHSAQARLFFFQLHRGGVVVDKGQYENIKLDFVDPLL